MRIRLIVLLLVQAYTFLFQNVQAGCTNGTTLISGKPDYPPISWSQYDELTGFGYDVIQKILAENSINIKKSGPFPWKRTLTMLESGELDIVVGIRSTAEREKYMSFIPTPIIKSAQNIFFRQGAKIQSSDDLRGKTGGVLLGTTYTEEFNLFSENNLTFEAVNSLKQNLQKLQLGRIHYFIAPLLPTVHYMRKNNLNLGVRFIAQPAFTVEEKIAISKKSDCIRYLTTIDRQLIKLKNQGFIFDLFDKQTQEWDVLEYLKPSSK